MKQLQQKLTTPPQLLVTEGATDDQEETQVGGKENDCTILLKCSGIKLCLCVICGLPSIKSSLASFSKSLQLSLARTSLRIPNLLEVDWITWSHNQKLHNNHSLM